MYSSLQYFVTFFLFNRILLNKDQAAAAMVAAVKRQRETKNASGNQGARPIGKELRLSDR